MFTTQTAALPQSLAMTTRDTCLCQLSVPSPHVTPHTRGRAELTLTWVRRRHRSYHQTLLKACHPHYLYFHPRLNYHSMHLSHGSFSSLIKDFLHFIPVDWTTPSEVLAKEHIGTWPRQLFAGIQSQRGQGREVQSKSKIDESIFVLYFVKMLCIWECSILTLWWLIILTGLLLSRLSPVW